MKKLIGVVALSLSLAAALPVAAAETLAINDDFSNYVSTDGVTVPDGWKSTSASLTGTDTSMKSVPEDGNTFIQIYAGGVNQRKVRIQKTQFDNPVGQDYVLKFRFMTNYPKEGAYIDSPFVEFGNCLSGTSASQVTLMQLKGGGIISPIGGSSGTQASAEERGGVVPKYIANHWYNMTIVSQSEGTDLRLTTYVDDVMLDTRLLSELGKTPANLSWIQFGINASSGTAITANYDDIKLYTEYNEFAIQSGTVMDGATNVDGSKDITYYFNNDILPSGIENITVTDESGKNISKSVTRVGMNGVKLHFEEVLDPGGKYTVHFNGISDLLGGTLQRDIGFSTDSMSIETKIAQFQMNNGTIDADISYTNKKSNSGCTAQSIAAVYDADGVLIGAHIIDVALDAKETKTENVSIGNGTLTRDCALKVFCMKDMTTLVPISNVAYQSNIGKAITLPSDFETLSFDIYRNGVGSYSHNETVDKVLDTSKALNVYISANQVSMLGLTADEPTNINQFTANIRNNRYEGYTDFILNLTDDIMVDPMLMDVQSLNISNLMFKSTSPSGMTWLGQTADISDWTQHSGNVYKTTMVSAGTVLFPVDTKSVDEYGMPRPYDVVTSLDACIATEGTFYVDGTDVYVNKNSNDNISDMNVILKNRILDIYNWTNQKIIIDNVGFLGGQYKFQGQTTDSQLYVFNSKFYRGETNAFYIIGYYKAYVFDSVAAYANADGFNYHSSTHESLAVEVNCVSYENGKYKIAGGATGTTSNNGSTAHDSIKVLRVGGRYWNCEGPIVADVFNCYSINIGCDARTVLPTTTGVCSGFSFSNAKGGADDIDYMQKKYVIDCYAGGDNLKDGGFRYDSDVSELPVIGLDLRGDTTQNRPYSFTITWDDILNGTW